MKRTKECSGRREKGRNDHRKLNIHFVRHGEVHNPKQIFYGRLPGYRITEKTKENAKLLAKSLENFQLKHKGKILRIYCSPMQRAVETCNCLVKELDPKPAVIKCEDIIESDVKVQGYSFKRIREEIGGFEYIYKFGPEKLSDVLNRVGEFIENIWKRFASVDGGHSTMFYSR
eukprot:UN27461